MRTTTRSSKSRISTLICIFLVVLLPNVTVQVAARAILGIDLGSVWMKVALVQRGAPLEIVTNLHSKRKTEHLILFDSGTRFYGADASSLLARKPLKTPSTMSVMLGKESDHPTVKVLKERHYPLTPVYNATRAGLSLTVDGHDFTPEELVAMVLLHAKEITATYNGNLLPAMLRDVVLTVPSFATQHERRALLDAAALADLNVLALLDETTAAALHFGMDKVMDPPEIYLFYNLGASALQVSVVRYYSYQHQDGKYGKPKTVGALEVLSKAWDSTLGGNALDHLIVEYLAEEFHKQWKDDSGDRIQDDERAMTKLRLQANKVKHVLSANTEIPIYMDALHQDRALNTHMTRAKLEELAHSLMKRSIRPIEVALNAANVTLDQIAAIELIGGGMRVPRIQSELSEHLKMELGLHLNSDESMALGAAFYGANISTAFKVRHVGLTDVNPFTIQVSLNNLVSSKPKTKSEEEEEEWSKQATMFKSFAKLGIKKTIAFTHDEDVHCAIDYEENEFLPEGTFPSIEQYNITGISKFAKEMQDKGLGKPKVSLQFELNPSGITQLVKAEAAVEEIVMVEEEEEVDDDEEEADAVKTQETKSDDMPDEKPKEETTETEKSTKDEATKDEATKDEATKNEATKNETKSDDEKSNETKAEPAKKKTTKKKKKILVQKEKTKVHRQTLQVESFHVGSVRPYSPELMAESKAKLAELERRDRERVMLEEARNKVESYIYRIKNKLIDEEAIIAKVSTEAQREEISKLAADAEEWMYDDGYKADLATMEDKYAELSVPAEKIFFRVEELEKRPEALAALRAKMQKVEELMKKWETSMPQVTEEERTEVLGKVEEVKTWIGEMEEAQAKADPTADPVVKSEDVPGQSKSIEALVTRLSRKPKPKPEKKNETKTEGNETKMEANETTTEGNETNANETRKEGSSETTEEPTAEEEKKAEDEKRADDEL